MLNLLLWLSCIAFCRGYFNYTLMLIVESLFLRFFFECICCCQSSICKSSFGLVQLDNHAFIKHVRVTLIAPPPTHTFKPVPLTTASMPTRWSRCYPCSHSPIPSSICESRGYLQVVFHVIPRCDFDDPDPTIQDLTTRLLLLPWCCEVVVIATRDRITSPPPHFLSLFRTAGCKSLATDSYHGVIIPTLLA